MIEGALRKTAASKKRKSLNKMKMRSATDY